MPKTLEGFLEAHSLDSALAFPVLESTVLKEHRMIRFAVSPHAEHLAFLAQESPEGISRPVFHIDAYEAFGILPNGQLRFAIYDAQGKLAPAARQFVLCATGDQDDRGTRPNCSNSCNLCR